MSDLSLALQSDPQSMLDALLKPPLPEVDSFWVQHQPAKHLARTALLSLEALGVYERLRNLQFVIGRLPIKKLAMLLQVTEGRWSALRAELDEAELVREVDGKLYCPDMEKAIEETESLRKKRREAGRKGGLASAGGRQ